jgi:dihydrofolate reductase
MVTARPRVSVFLAMSLDGFIARLDGGLDWLDPMHAGGEDYGYPAFFASVDTVVVGRRTYDVVLGFPEWPYAGKRVVVLTHRAPAPRRGETFFCGAPDALLDHLAALGVRHAYADGGATVSQLLAAGLVDDLTVSVVPVVLGDGIRLFQVSSPTRPLRLVGSQAFASGLVQLRYEVGREA